MQTTKYLDPFNVPTQLNNVCVLIIAYVAKTSNDETQCHDPNIEGFLYFILYGSLLVCTVTLLLSILYMIGAVDYCINKVFPCGEVCLTLNTLGIYLMGIIYHCIATVYGIIVLRSEKSACIELEMFKRITGIIYAVWILGIILVLGFLCFRSAIRNKYSELQGRLIEA